MIKEQQDLWKVIKNFEIDDLSSDYTFTMRLARENRWNIQYTLRVILEYKKFIFLAAVCNHHVTPSDQVDQAWHLHLLYTRSYWNELCGGILKKDLHHGPTKGGSKERSKYKSFYTMTLSSYRERFDSEPPLDIWPNEKIRFGDINFIRVNLNRYWLIPRLFKK